ncbi:MAG: hypothetical protein V2A77_10955 [Pseudomonadota bacterium]
MAIDIRNRELAVPSEAELEEMVLLETTMDAQAYRFVAPSITFKGGVFTVENSDLANRTLDAVVVLSRITRGLWIGDAVQPVCSSRDGVVGVVSDGGQRPCFSCQYNEWGSDPKGGRGKACGEYRLLVVIPDGMRVPLRLRLPVTSIGAWDQYATNLALSKKARAYFTVLTHFGLTKEAGEGAIEYYTITCAMQRELALAEVVNVLSLRKQYAELVARTASADLMQEDSDLPFDEPPSEDEGPTIEGGVQDGIPF